MALFAALINAAFWGLIWSVEHVEQFRLRRKWSEEGEGVPWMEDYYTNGPLGTLVGLSVLDAGIMLMVSNQAQSMSIWLVLGALLFGIGATYVYFKNALNPERVARNIDWWFIRGGPGGKLWFSLAGRIHLAYMACQFSWIAIGILLLGSGIFGSLYVPGFLVALAGGTIYAIAYRLDDTMGRLF